MSTVTPWVYPVGDPLELARRLDLGTPSAAVLALLADCLGRAGDMIQPHTDRDLSAALPTIYLEAVYQLAVKDWQIGVQGVNSLDPEGEYTYTPGATAGLVRAVWAYIAPLNRTGGLTV